MSATPDLVLKVFISAAIVASLADMLLLQSLKRYVPDFSSPSFYQNNLSWVARMPGVRQLVGGSALEFMKTRTIWFPATEIIFATAAAATLYEFGLTYAFFRTMSFIYLALLLTIISLKTPGFLVPHRVTVWAIPFALITGAVPGALGPDSQALVDTTLGALLGLGLFGGIYLGGYVYAAVALPDDTPRNVAFGMGNVVAAIMVGAFCGWQRMLPMVLITTFSGAIGAYIVIFYRSFAQGRLQIGPATSYPPYIYFGGAVSLIFYSEIQALLAG